MRRLDPGKLHCHVSCATFPMRLVGANEWVLRNTQQLSATPGSKDRDAGAVIPYEYSDFGESLTLPTPTANNLKDPLCRTLQ
ncbi:hypothetical protein OKW35_006883 [Paraburkholderia sp. MM5477-R1]